MSIDVASLVFEIDSTQAVTARERLEALENVGAKVDASARRIKTATEQAGIGIDTIGAASKRAAISATEHAEKQGAAEQATRRAEQAAVRAAEREAQAWARVEAQLEKRNAAYRGSQALAAMRDEAAAAGALETRIDRLMNSIDPTRAAQSRLNAEMAEANALYKAGAISASDYAKATSVLDKRLAEAARGQVALNGVMVHGAASSKVATQAGLNLSRQFADIGVTAAMGMNPLMILIQQGPQIADAFAQAKSQGMGFSAVLATLQAQMAPFVALLAPIAIAAGATAAAFGLLHRELSKSYPKDITDGLGLTEEQLERVEDRTVTFGDTFAATMDVAAKYLMQGPLGAAIDDLNARWNAWLDDITANTVEEVATIIGAFIGAYRTIVANWKNFPAVFGDFFAMGVNAALDSIEVLVNGAIVGLNKIFDVMRLAPQWSWLPKIGDVDLEGYKAQVTGAAEFTGKALLANIGGAIDEVRAGMGRLGNEIGAGAVKRAQDRALEDAGKAAKTSASKGRTGPADRSNEELLRLEQELARSRAEELQAQLALTEDVRARAELEKQLLDIQLDEKRAELAKQAAKIERDVAQKRITEATGDLMRLELAALELSAARVASLKAELIDREATRALIRNAYAIETAGLQDIIDRFGSERETARFAYERSEIERRILQHQHTIERLKLQEIVDTTAAGSVEREIAEARLRVLGAIQANQEEARRLRTLEAATSEAARAIYDVSNAIREHDWGRAFQSLIKAVDQAVTAFANAKTGADRMSAAGSLFSAAGGAIGGTAGNVLGAVGSGFSAAGAAAGMAGTMGSLGTAIAGMAGPIGIAVAGFTLLNSVLSNQAAKKRAKQEQEARDIQNARQAAQEQANKRAELELRILELSGDEVGALTKKREAEIAVLDASNRALQQYVYALEDWEEAVGKAKSAVSKAEDDLRDAYNAEKQRLESIVGGVLTARDRLNDAYQRERAAIEKTADSVRSLIEQLADFRSEIDMMSAANDPTGQYGYAERQFATATNDNLIERGRAFANASQSASATDLDFQRDLAAVRRRTDEASKTATEQLTTAERQLQALDAMVAPLLAVNDNLLSVEQAIQALATAEMEAAIATEELARLDAQVGALITINTSVLTVAQAIANLEGAIASLAAAEAAKPTNNPGSGYQAVGYEGYVDRNSDLAALYASGEGMARGRSKAEFGAYHWERYGQAESRAYRPFARGGDHLGGLRLVGEEGPELEATGPSRIFSARQTAEMLRGDNSDLQQELRAIRQELAALRKERAEDARQIKQNTKDVSTAMAKVTQGGDKVRVTEVAA